MLTATAALLDPIESNVGESTSSLGRCGLSGDIPAGYPARHRGWWRTRERTRAALADTYPPAARLRAWDNCGTVFYVLRSTSNPKMHKIVTGSCHDRLCTPCQGQRAAVITANLKKHLTDHPYRLVTLTLAATDVPLREQLTRLYTCFKKLRSTKLWKRCITGGAAFLEITLNEGTQLWHPHLHLITEGKYIPQQQLSTTWQEITGDSKVVDVRMISNRNAAASYVVKYVTKAHQHAITRNPQPFADLIVAIKSRKLVMPFGSWRSWHLTAPPTDSDWKLLGRLDELASETWCTPHEACCFRDYFRYHEAAIDGLIFELDTS